MKLGQRFGIGKGGIDLYCTVEGFDGPNIEFYVINGDWYGTLKPDQTVIIQAPNGGLFTKVDTFYLWCIPHGDYNDAIQYMNAQLKKPRVCLYCQDYIFRLMLRYNRFVGACRAATAAFKTAWKRERPVKAGFEDMDDDIPF